MLLPIPNKLSILKLSLYSFIGLLAAISFFWVFKLFQITDYTEFISFVAQLFEESFLVKDIEKNFILKEHFTQIQKSKYLFLFEILALTGLSTSLLQTTLVKLPSRVKKLKFNYSKQNTLIFYGLILVWLCYKIFLFYYLPAHMDEMFDYIFYAKSNLITRHTYIFTDDKQWYNNHLLYSDISSIFYNLGFPQKLAMRLPSILGEFFLFLYLWFRFKKARILKIHFILLVLASSFWAGIYSVEARSYYLVGVCTLISFFLVKDLLKKPNKQQFLAFVLVSLIGFGLNKLYAIPFVGIVFFISIMQKSKKDIAFWFRTLLLIGLLTLLFYTPALIISGKRAIYTNIDSPNDLGLKLYPVLLEGLSVITNINQKSYLGLLSLGILIVVFRKRISLLSRRLSLFFLTQLISLALFTVLLGSYMPERAFIYLNLCFYLMLAIFIWDLLKKQKVWLFTVLLVLIANTIFNFNFSWMSENQRFVLGRTYYNQVEQAAEQMNKKGINWLYVEHSDFQSLIFAKYYLKSSQFSGTTIEKIKAHQKLLSNKELDTTAFKKSELIPDFDIFIYTKKD